MKFNRILHTVLLTSGLMGFALTSHATTLGQACELNNTCPIPGNDGGQTKFIVGPANGMDYICHVKSSGGGSLKFAITGGGNLSITQGEGLYNANPEARVELKARFKHPEDVNNMGEIRFTKLPFSSEGTVTCVAKE